MCCWFGWYYFDIFFGF